MEPQKEDKTWLRGKSASERQAEGERMQGPESKSVISPDHEREERAHGEADLGGRPDLARSYCLTLGLGSHIYLFPNT